MFSRIRFKLTFEAHRLNMDLVYGRSMRLALERIPRLYLIPECKSLFIHIPKAAGSSIRSSGLFSSATKISGVAPSGHLPLQKIGDILGDEFVDRLNVFTFVRHPLTRFESAYRYIMSGGNHEGDAKICRHISSNYAGFSDFVDGFDSDNFLNVCPHFRPMWSYFGASVSEAEAAVRRLLFIGRFESLHSDWQCLLQLLGKDPMDLPKANPTKSIISLGVEDREYLRLHQRFNQYYQHDFRLFGYAPQA